jgi:hypothetical protein
VNAASNCAGDNDLLAHFASNPIVFFIANSCMSARSRRDICAETGSLARRASRLLSIRVKAEGGHGAAT